MSEHDGQQVHRTVPGGPVAAFRAARRRRRLRELARRAQWAADVHATPTLQERMDQGRM